MKKKIILTLVILLLLYIIISFLSTPFCFDGFGQDSYFPNDGSLNITQWQLSTPDEIKNLRVAYIDIDECSSKKEYYVRENNVFAKVTEEQLQSFVNQYNVSCDGCLDIYYSGCC